MGVIIETRTWIRSAVRGITRDSPAPLCKLNEVSTKTELVQ